MNAASTEVKNRFGEFMDKAQREPVTIEKTGRSYAVLVGFEEYQRLLACEDALWAAKADAAKASGFVGSDAAMQILEELK